MNYLVIDLEMCNVPKHYRSSRYPYNNEIIQIGAVLLDENFEIIESMNQYVKPVYGVLDYFISSFTGIEKQEVKNAPELKEVLLQMMDWLGEREYQIFQWSNTDYYQLKHEVCSKNLLDEKIERFMEPVRWVDYQKIFGNRFGFSRAVSLEDALKCCEIEVEGRLHDGLADAVNTGKLIRWLESNPEFEIEEIEEVPREEERLNYSLGNLLAAFQFD